MVLPMIYYPNEILRKKSLPVENPDIKEISSLIDDMIQTMESHRGIGLAAPQIGKNIRLVIVDTENGPLPLLNPVITKRSFRKENGDEGCLSIPEIFGTVKRPVRITVKAQNIQGETVTFPADGLFARVIQHEIDHIDGILFIDKAKDLHGPRHAVERFQIENVSIDE